MYFIKECLQVNVNNILIPFGTSIHTRLATEIAPAIVKYFNAKLTVGMVLDPKISEADKNQKIDDMKKTLQENTLEAEIKTTTDRDILRGMLRLASKADLVLMAGRSGEFLELMLAKSITQEFTERSKCPVIWIKEYEERESFWSSLLKSDKGIGEQNG